MPIVKGLLENAGIEHDKTFVRPDTTVEVTDNSGNKSYKQVQDLSQEEKQVFESRGAAPTGMSATGRTANPTIFSMAQLVDQSTPQIKINDMKTGLVITGTKEALDSSLGTQLQKYLDDTFKYSDLSSTNVADSIEKLNQSLREQVSKSVAETTKFDNGEYNNYLNAIETMNRQNPMSLSGDDSREKYGIWGYEKDGKRSRKLPQEWIDYWRENYSSKERAALFDYSKRLAKGQITDASPEVLTDFNLFTPYLVMSGGERGDSPVYGFDPWEQLVGGGEAFVNEINKLGKGIQDMGSQAAWWLTNSQGYTRKNVLNDIAKKFGVSEDITSDDAKWMTEEEWNNRINSIVGKKIDELSDDDKKFLATSLSDKFNNNTVLQIITDEDGTINDNMLKERAITQYGQERVGGNISYQDYINARDNLSTIEEYGKRREEISEDAPYDWTNLEDEVSLAQIYAPVNVGAGTFAGVILRTLAESGLVSGLTGGVVNLSNVGDDLAEGIIKLSGAASKEIGTAGAITEALNKPFGKFLLSLAGEIPEDVLQTAVDNVIIENSEDNLSLLTPENLADNTIQNLIFRAVFGGAGKTVDYVSTRNAIKKLQRQAPQLKTVDPDVLFGEYNEFKNARNAGDNISFDSEGRAVITDGNGNTKTLENVKASIFNNTGDAQLDAIGDAWRATHSDGSTVKLGDVTPKMSEYKQPLNYESNVLHPEARRFTEDLTERIDGIGDARKIKGKNGLSLYDVLDPYEGHGAQINEINKILREGSKRNYKGKDLIEKWGRIGTSTMRPADGEDYVWTAKGIDVQKDSPKLVDDIRDWAAGEHRTTSDISFESLNDEIAKKYAYDAPDRNESGEYGDSYIIYTGYPEGARFINYMDDTIFPNDGSPDGMFGNGDGGRIANVMDAGYTVVSVEKVGTNEGGGDVYKVVRVMDAPDGARTSADTSSLDARYTPDSSSEQWAAPRIRKDYYSSGDSIDNVTVKAINDLPANPTQLENWHANAEASVMEAFDDNFIPNFERAYTTPEDQTAFVRNMDYLFWLQRKKGKDLKSAIGSTYESDGLEFKVTDDDVKFYQENIEPMMAPLRDASQEALGVDVPTFVGYFPHTDYSPEHMTAEEIIDQGVLYKEFSGASVMDNGNFTTSKLTDNIRERYRVFANNMLWDAAGDRVAAARLMEEFHADGVDATPEQANAIIASKKAQANALKKSDGAKAVREHLDSNKPKYDYTEIQDKIQKSSGGYAQRIHDGFGGVYGTASGTYAQPGRTRTISNSDWMRGMQTPDGSLYDNGGRMVVAGDADAGFLAKRIFEENITGRRLKDLFVEYLSQGGRRTAKGAEYIADKWINKLMAKASNKPISRASLAADLQNMIYFEGVSRVNRWVARADLIKFSKNNMGALDSFLYRQGIITRQLSDSGIMGKINSATNKIISARMKSLFWFNYKNGVLQLSECIRLFTEFDLGDARSVIRKMLTDEDFRREVDEWVNLIIPEKYSDAVGEGARSRMLEGTAEAMEKISSKASYKNGVLEVGELTAQELKDLGKAFDKFATSPVDFGENTKNRIIMAGILQEAQRKGLSGNELFNYVNKRFERIGLAANDMGKLTAADNPFFRIATNLKSFGIRETNMYINNIRDLNTTSGHGAVVSYIIKNLGWKGGLLLIMSKLGYGALSVFGLDPFGLMDDQYTGVDEEDYNWLDHVVSNPATNALLSGGFTSFIPQLYWASRQAYEGQITPSEEMERSLDENRQTPLGSFEFANLSFDDIRKIGMGFIPGYTQTQRTLSMTDLLNRGWATGATGNKKYEAPDNMFDAAAGYLFGPSNTPNARAYNQTPDYLQGFLEGGLPGVAQQIGREWGGYRQFDPIDQQNYSDWFNGTKADEAQWRAGYYYFSDSMQDILNRYAENEKNARDDTQIQELKTTLNAQIAQLQDRLRAFTNAYTLKHPEGIDEEKMNNLINILNTYQSLPGETLDERNTRKLEEWNNALNRYSQAGLPAITTYKGTEDGAEVVYSPQVRAALQGRFGLPEEASKRIKELYDSKWKDLNKQYRDIYYSTKGTKNKQAIQKEYIGIIRQDLDPIVNLYGGEIFQNDVVEDVVEDVFNSMIPKYGQTAKSYLKNLYKDYHGTIRYSEGGNRTLTQINNLLDQGKTSQAKALARTLRQRVQENRTSLTRAELERLQKILND